MSLGFVLDSTLINTPNIYQTKQFAVLKIKVQIVNKHKLILNSRYHFRHRTYLPKNLQIFYSLPKQGRIKLVLYDLSGKVVKNLINAYQNAGIYSMTFNAFNLPIGIYFLSLETNNKRTVTKLVIVK